MNHFNYQKTIEKNKADYNDPIWNVYCYCRNLLLIAGGIYLLAKTISEDDNTPATRLYFFFLSLLIAFIVFRTYKRMTGYKLEQMDTSLSMADNQKFILHFLDEDEEYGLSVCEPEYIIMQRQGFRLGLFTPHQVSIMFFDGYILFNGQNIDKYGRLFPPVIGSVIRRELFNALQSFNATTK